jgi:hypothetical protein
MTSRTPSAPTTRSASRWTRAHTKVENISFDAWADRWLDPLETKNTRDGRKERKRQAAKLAKACHRTAR